MLKIALLDDKKYGLNQIKEIHEGENFKLFYFSTFQEFKKNSNIFDIVYLDYFLEKDGLTGAEVLPFVKSKTKKVIGFSSVLSRSKELKQLGADNAIVKKFF